MAGAVGERGGGGDRVAQESVIRMRRRRGSMAVVIPRGRVRGVVAGRDDLAAARAQAKIAA
jgi:hypothetical protein